jgi:hypothetical protein
MPALHVHSAFSKNWLVYRGNIDGASEIARAKFESNLVVMQNCYFFSADFTAFVILNYDGAL